MSDRAQRFQELINALKTNQLRFTNAIGVKYSQTNAIYNGKKEFSRNYLHKISEKYPNVNTHWILTGKGAMFLDQQEAKNTGYVSEPNFEYGKSTNDGQFVIVPDDLELRKTLGSNLITLANRWRMKKNELFSLIMPGVQKQSVTNYMKGSSQPPLGVLIRLEMVSGITISHFLTRILDIMEMPSHPIDASQERQDQITLVRKELRALLEKLGG